MNDVTINTSRAQPLLLHSLSMSMLYKDNKFAIMFKNPKHCNKSYYTVL